jgi:hypothetical protein
MRLIAVCTVLLLSGCSLNKQFVAAEMATYEAIGPRYVEYTNADPTLDAEVKALRVRTVEMWKATLDEASK